MTIINLWLCDFWCDTVANNRVIYVWYLTTWLVYNAGEMNNVSAVLAGCIFFHLRQRFQTNVELLIFYIFTHFFQNWCQGLLKILWKLEVLSKKSISYCWEDLYPYGYSLLEMIDLVLLTYSCYIILMNVCNCVLSLTSNL